MKDFKILLFTSKISMKLRLNDKPQMSGGKEEIKSSSDHHCILDVIYWKHNIPFFD
jgi:hypothetical protein